MKYRLIDLFVRLVCLLIASERISSRKIGNKYLNIAVVGHSSLCVNKDITTCAAF